MATRKPDPDCELCNDTGLVARRNTYPCAYVCPGPVPEDARNVYEAYCECETGNAMWRAERRRQSADELRRLGLSVPSRSKPTA